MDEEAFFTAEMRRLVLDNIRRREQERSRTLEPPREPPVPPGLRRRAPRTHPLSI